MNIIKLQARVNEILSKADTVADAKRMAREDGKVNEFFLEIIDEIIDNKMNKMRVGTAAEVAKIRAIGLDFFKPTELEKCDKCGEDVQPGNSARTAGHIVYGCDTFPMIFQLDRHLYPVGDCEGSPSRVELIGGNPEWAAAYCKMQA